MVTYADLLTYAPLALIAQNRDTVAEMPNIVRRAQGYLVQRLDHDLFRTDLAILPVAETGIVDTISVPGTLLEVRQVLIETATDRWMPILRRSDEMLQMLFTDTLRGPARFYSFTAAGALKVYPAPGRVTRARVTANVAPPVLSDTVQTNIILEQFPELMELAVTMEAAVFNLDPASTGIYQGRVGEHLQTANAQISRRTRDESAQRTVETRNITGA
jgi:hypothetical protein